jgi:hypothetical protein
MIELTYKSDDKAVQTQNFGENEDKNHSDEKAWSSEVDWKSEVKSQTQVLEFLWFVSRHALLGCSSNTCISDDTDSESSSKTS